MQANWVAPVERLDEMPDGSEHQRVGGEWSALQTWPNLVFVHESIGPAVYGDRVGVPART